MSFQPESRSEWIVSPQTSGPLHVLVAEENELDLILTERLLTLRGHRVTTVTTGRGVLEALPHDRFDILLTDLEMPGLSGLELARAIRAVEAEEVVLARDALPIIAMTAHDSEELAKVCAEAGMDGFLSKPIKSDPLHAILTDAVRLRGLRRRPRPKDVGPRMGQPRVLVADDNPIHQRLMEAILAREGFSVCVVENGRDAWEAVKREAFDTVLLDLQMPVMTGLEAASRIRTVYNSAELPLVAVTSAFREIDLRTCTECGFDYHLQKPLEPSLLVEMTRFCCVQSDRDIDPALVETLRFSEEAPIFDREGVLELVAGDLEFLTELVELFELNVTELFGKIYAQLQQNQIGELKYLVHALRSPISSFSQGRPLRLTAELEHAIHNANYDRARTLFDSLTTVTRQLLAELQDFLEHQGVTPPAFLLRSRNPKHAV